MKNETIFVIVVLGVAIVAMNKEQAIGALIIIGIALMWLINRWLNHED